MSISEPAAAATDFDVWIAKEFAETGSFTAFAVLVKISETKVSPLASTYFQVIGDEITWPEIVVMFTGAGSEWDGVSFFPTLGKDGGMLDNPTARTKLRELEARIDHDRLVLNEGHFFDKWGRRLKIEEVGLQ